VKLEARLAHCLADRLATEQTLVEESSKRLGTVTGNGPEWAEKRLCSDLEKTRGPAADTHQTGLARSSMAGVEEDERLLPLQACSDLIAQVLGIHHAVVEGKLRPLGSGARPAAVTNEMPGVVVPASHGFRESQIAGFHRFDPPAHSISLLHQEGKFLYGTFEVAPFRTYDRETP